MVTRRTLAILAVVVVVLVGISAVQKLGHRRATSRAASSVLVEGTYTAESVGRLELGRGAETRAVVLASGPDGWRVETAWSARASRERIDALLSALGDLHGEYRSDSRDVLGDYGLDDEAAVTIRAFGRDGQPLFGLDVGGRPQGGAGNFVRRPGADEVYLTTAGILAQLGIYGEPTLPSSRHFLDLQAVKEERVAVDAIRLREATGTREYRKVFSPPAAADSASVAAVRNTWEWQAAPGTRGPTPAKTKVDAVLGSLVSVRAADLGDPAAPASAYGLDAPLREATLVMADGREVVLEFGADRPAEGDKPGGTWLRVRGDPSIWVATEYTMKNVFKSADELKAD
ncbi:MAG: DUF4340 domain-containing protein [bacterium]|nr:DUF4340 domain-containing protein [bacterium]